MNSPAFHWRKDDESGLLRDDDSRSGPAREATEYAIKYCLHCDWEVRPGNGDTKYERTRKAVDHHVSTGHTVDSIPSTDVGTVSPGPG